MAPPVGRNPRASGRLAFDTGICEGLARRVSPQSLQTEELAGLTRENMHYNAEIVKKYPHAILHTFDMVCPLTLALQLQRHLLGERLRVDCRSRGGDNEIVGQRRTVPQIQHNDVFTQLGEDDGCRPLRQPSRSHG